MSCRWFTAGLLTFTAGLARPTATALIGGLVLSALLALRKPRGDGVARPLTAIVVAPLGLVGYLAWVGHRMGDRAGYFKLQEGAWAHTFDGAGTPSRSSPPWRWATSTTCSRARRRT